MIDLLRQLIIILIAVVLGGFVYLRMLDWLVHFFEIPMMEWISNEGVEKTVTGDMLFYSCLILLFCHGLATFVALTVTYGVTKPYERKVMVGWVSLMMILAIVNHYWYLNLTMFSFLADVMINILICMGFYFVCLKRTTS